LRGKKGAKHTLTYLSGRRKKTLSFAATIEARGWPHTYNMPEGLTRHGRSCWYTALPSGVGYIYLRRIDQSTEPGIAAALKAHPDAKGWIIDLRGNGGGGYGGDLIRRLAGIPGPVAGLIDAGCFSAGETMARDIVRYAKARLFGSTTAGSSSAKRTWTFPSGISTIIIPTRSRTGIVKCIEYNGISPHEPVEAVPEEVAAGKNSAILRAEEYLQKQRGR
jgi:C-terminal processing protease CtpA/Prc